MNTTVVKLAHCFYNDMFGFLANKDVIRSCPPLAGGEGKNCDGEEISAAVTKLAYWEMTGVRISATSLRPLEISGLTS